jgi:membrane protein insertase Oxa1/YidC/SpoIIIJ
MANGLLIYWVTMTVFSIVMKYKNSKCDCHKAKKA